MSEQVRKSLRDRAMELNTALPKWVEGKEKGKTEDLVGQISTINNFDFVPDGDSDYAVFTVAQRPKSFYFAGMVLTDALHKLESDGYKDEILAEGLPVRFEIKESRNYDASGKIKLKYTNAIMYPEA